MSNQTSSRTQGIFYYDSDEVVLAFFNIIAESKENPTNCLHDHGNVVLVRLAFLYLKNLTRDIEPRVAFVHTCYGGREDARLDGFVDTAEQSLVAFVA